MIKGVIHYSDGRIEDPIRAMVQESIEDSGLQIVSSYLTPGEERCYPQMVRQIIECLTRSEAQAVFFCEHDVIYSKSHFEFWPERDDLFYYNRNVWRWDYPENRYITYDRMISLSALCVNRLFALDHFTRRLAAIVEGGNDTAQKGEPDWVRKMGYEPGTKKIKRGGFSDDDFETWASERPLIDIRHDKTFSPRKVQLADFTHPPVNWREAYERP